MMIGRPFYWIWRLESYNVLARLVCNKMHFAWLFRKFFIFNLVLLYFFFFPTNDNEERVKIRSKANPVVGGMERGRVYLTRNPFLDWVNLTL